MIWWTSKNKDKEELSEFVYETFLINTIGRRLRQHMYKVKAITYDRERPIPFPCNMEQLFDKIQAAEIISWNPYHLTNAKCILIEQLVTYSQIV